MLEDDNLTDAIDLLYRIAAKDPDMPVFDLEARGFSPAKLCLVRANFLDNLWEQLHPGELIPHDHIGNIY